MLKSVAVEQSVKRVVLTSSVVAIANPQEDPPAGTVNSPDTWLEGTSVQNAAQVYAHSKVRKPYTLNPNRGSQTHIERFCAELHAGACVTLDIERSSWDWH